MTQYPPSNRFIAGRAPGYSIRGDGGMADSIEYSIVIPVYNSEKTLHELYSRIVRVFNGISENFEIVLVDDCSHDDSWSIMKELRSQDERVKIIHLARNFGQHNATLCGFHHCNGRYVVIMDDDLQHPPEEIPVLIKKLDEGYLAVYGDYKVKCHSKIENFFSRVFGHIMHMVLDIPETVYISSFAVFASEVIKNATSIRSAHVFLPAVISKSVPMNKIGSVEVIHNPRKAGSSNYSFIKYLKLSLNLIINYSALPLIFVIAFGLLMSLLSIAYGTSIVANWLLHPGSGVMGWNSLIVAVTFLSGVILMSMGVIGEYVRRILAELTYEQPFLIGEMEI